MHAGLWYQIYSHSRMFGCSLGGGVPGQDVAFHLFLPHHYL